MPITLVQSNSSGTSSANPTTLAFGSNTTKGNLLVVSFSLNGSLSSFTNTGGDTYNTSNLFTDSFGFTSYIAYVLSTGGGADSITVQCTSSVVMMTIAEFNAGAGSSFSGLDGTFVTGQAASGTAMSAGPIVTTNANDLIIGLGVLQSGPPTAGASFTKIGSIGFAASELGISEYRIVSATGSYNVTATQSGSNNWSICGLAFKSVASAKAPSPPFPWYVVEVPH